MFLLNPMYSYQLLHGGYLKNFFIRLVTKSINTEHLSEFLRQVKILSLKSISILLKPFLRNPKRSLFLYYLFNQWPWLLSIYIGTISSWKWSILWQWVYFQLLEVHSHLQIRNDILVQSLPSFTRKFSGYSCSSDIYLFFFSCHTFSSTISATRHLLFSRAT